MLNDSLLQVFMDGFYGYGNLKAKYWFVGMEEGGGQTIEEITARLETWDQHGRPVLDDLRRFHHDARLYDWFRKASPLQKTWRALILTVLAAEDGDTTATSLVEYQRTQLGKAGGETALIETLPLPSPGTQTWNYAKWSRLAVLRDRKTYQTAYFERRRDRVIDLVRAANPLAVIFYGNSQDWSKRFGLKAVPPYRIDAADCGDSLIIATDHPGARTNDAPARFEAIGKLIADKRKPAA